MCILHTKIKILTEHTMYGFPYLVINYVTETISWPTIYKHKFKEGK